MSEETKRIGVGVVGLDHWYAGIGAVDGLLRHKAAQVVVVAHRDQEKLREFAAERGITETTTDYYSVAGRPDVDLVVTACTTAENVEICLDAARRGKHIVSVKPFAMNLAEADRLRAAVGEANVLFASFDGLYRLAAQSQLYKRWIDEGRIGTPISATIVQRANLEGASMDWPGRRTEKTWWRDPRQVPGGGWIDHAIYQVDLLRWLLDDEVARVTGVAKTLMHPELPKELEDFGVALLEFRKGLVATVEVTWATKPGIGGGFTQLVGTEGAIHYDPLLTGKLSVAGNFESPLGSGWTSFSPPARRGGGGMAEHVVDRLVAGRRPVATIDDARANLEVCLAFYEAARTGRAVDL